MKQFFLFICAFVCFNGIAQKNISINDQPISFDCAKIISVDELDTINYQKIKIYHAQINANCLELGIFYGDCPTNIELVTDNKLIETQNLTLNFLLRYTKDSTPCNKHDKKATIFFDMLPYKNMRTDKFITIVFAGEKFNLKYK